MNIAHSLLRRDAQAVQSGALTTLWIWLLCLMCWAPSLHAADALGAKRMPLPEEAPKVEVQDKRPLTEFLDADGRLVIPEGFSGSLDPAGLSLVSKPGEPPRFAAKNAVDDPARWDDQFGQAIGCDGQVNAMAAFPDGKIVLGGILSVCGNVSVNQIAIWNPTTGAFESLGTGAANGVNGGVNALAITGTDVYVGGSFFEAGGASANRVARFNTSTQSWSPLGTSAANGVNNFVRALAVTGTDLYVGGSFTQAGGVGVNNVARFNASTQTWSPLGTGTANGVNNGVFVLAITGNDIYVGGQFTQAGGASANRVARFNTNTQSWSPLGTGAANGVNNSVRALTVTGTDLYVGGGFSQAGGASANRVARFNTSTQTWSPLGTGVANGVIGTVFALVIMGTDVYVGGFFQSGVVSANNVVRFNTGTQTWSPLGIGAANGVSEQVQALAITGTDVYVGGFFNEAGGVSADRVARFNTNTQVWSPLGTGAANGVNDDGYALAITGTDVYVGGVFTQAGGASANQVARFNTITQTWSPLGISAANGVDGVVNALAIMGTDVYVGGGFTQAGDVSANGVARFNTSTQTWSPLGTGAANGVSEQVQALAITGTDVYVGGFFNEAGGVIANNVARFNTSTQTWSPLGTGAANGVNGDVRALAITGMDVYVGGSFTQAGGVIANNVARFNTSTQTWSPLGTGAANGVDANVYALVVTGTDVYVGGDFTQAGGISANNVAHFNTNAQAWSPLGTGVANGVDGGVNALAVTGTDVYVGGNFTQAGGVSANNVARFNASMQTYAPEPGNAVVFPTGAVNTNVSATIAVTSGGAIGEGSTTLSCGFQGGQPASFAITGGNNQTVTASQGVVNLQLGCTLNQLLRTTTLSCTETDSPGGTTRSRTWPLSCGPGVAAADGRLTVGRRIGLRNQVVVIPVSFEGDGQTVTFDTQFSFDRSRLTVVSVQRAGSATCQRLPAPNDDRIRVQMSSTNPLPGSETKYCEVAFRVAGNALLGAIALPVVASTCTDGGGVSRLCMQVDGRVAVAGLELEPLDGANVVIAGYASTVNQERTLRVVNRGPASLQISSCAITPASGNLQVVAPVSFPLSLVPSATAEVRVRCALPGLGQERVGVLECATTDPMRGTMRYGLSCYTVPNGQPLPTAQLLDLEQRAGEQIGSSASRGSTPDGVLTVLGAPLGGAAGSGRVLVYGDAGGSTTAPGFLKLLVSLDGPARSAEKLAKNTGAISPRLGQSVALRSDGLQLAVGAPFDGPNGAGGSGRVYLYSRPANGWSNFDSRFDPPIVLEAPNLAGGSTAEFGQAVAYTPNGDLVVGAPGATSGVSGAGAVFVYARNGSTLDPPVSVTSANAVGNGRFGAALAARNDQVVVGASGEFSGANRTGAAYRIPLQGGVPSTAVRLTPTSALQANDRFGSSVAVSASLLVIGASGTDTSEGEDGGSAYLFQAGSSASGWVQATQLLPAVGSGSGQDMGSSVALSTDLIVVGAPRADVGGVVNRGRVYGYAVKASYGATERPSSVLENAGGRAEDEFGRSVVIGQGATVVGVPQADVSLLDNTQQPPVTTLLNDVGRADGFQLVERLFADGFE